MLTPDKQGFRLYYFRFGNPNFGGDRIRWIGIEREDKMLLDQTPYPKFHP
jgi:hypothetical protein